MYVTKRNGTREEVSFDKITTRLKNLSQGLRVDCIQVAQQVCTGLFNGVHTYQLDNLASETAAQLVTQHYDYALLAGRIEMSNLHKSTPNLFSNVISMLHQQKIIRDDMNTFVQNHKQTLNEAIVHDNDFTYDFFAFKTLERSYLLKCNNKILERPQFLLMRVACEIHRNDISQTLQTYRLLSEKKYIHATPTLFNAGTYCNQLASCFLLPIEDDSISGIYNTLKKCALISKYAGGIGMSVSNVRCFGSYIKGTNGLSNGIIPMLRVFNNTARYVDQGGGKRSGSIAIYLEPHHPDLLKFLQIRKNQGNEEERCRDLFTALWVSDLFMQRVEKNEQWTFFCPNEFPGLQDVYGDKYTQLYLQYENKCSNCTRLPARTIWQAIITSQQETGTPFILYKNSCNTKCNQNNLGTLRSSNLCTEILQYSSSNETAVCNLASISLPAFVNKKEFDFKALGAMTRQIVINLNKVIDNTFYAIPSAKLSNLNHRPMGIGTQGLAHVFMMYGYEYGDSNSQHLCEQIFECIYYNALYQSMTLAKTLGPYSSFKGSPASRGILQFDMWDYVPPSSCNYDWKSLRQNICTHGLRNSLLIAQMPTASTSQILGNTESCEPISSNLYIRRTSSGEFQVINKHLINSLHELKLWDQQMQDDLIKYRGSVQEIKRVPTKIKKIFKTAYELSGKTLVNMAITRAHFIDQSESFNCFIKKPTFSVLSALHFYTWRQGMKTGCYYIRSEPACDAQQITCTSCSS
jgi:ribonucleoside-diphosphate reductase alpha subunit